MKRSQKLRKSKEKVYIKRPRIRIKLQRKYKIQAKDNTRDLSTHYIRLRWV